MINELKKKILLIMLLPLCITVLIIILVYTVLNYNNMIDMTAHLVDRFNLGEPKPDIDMSNIDGVYEIYFENSKIVKGSSTDENINKYATSIINGKSNKGVIGDFIFHARTIKKDTVKVVLIEDLQTVSEIRKLFISSSVIAILFITIIYIISNHISKIIVKPVESTLNEQKQFISDASHELKTPLAVIKANADVLENEVGANKWVNYIQNEIQSMSKLVNELLLLAKIENIDNLKEFKNVNLSNEIEIIFSMFESVAYENNIKLISNINEEIYLNCNKEDIEHIVSTLVDNAIKHTTENGDVKIILKKEKNNILLEVQNKGLPIPDTEKDKIFERFYRIDKSRNRNEKRYGLGLAIAKATVEKYKGKIEVSNNNGYTVFSVIIPC